MIRSGPTSTGTLADIEHQLTVNEFYCRLKYHPIPVPGIAFHRWMSFFAPLVPGLRLIPDGYVEVRGESGFMAAFIEVDLGHERGNVWKIKVENYLRFALMRSEGDGIQRPFRVLVLAPSDRRLLSIRKHCPQAEDGASLGKPMTIRDVAALLGCSPWTIRQKYVPQGLPYLRASHAGKLIFFRNQVIDWILKQQTNELPEHPGLKSLAKYARKEQWK